MHTKDQDRVHPVRSRTSALQPFQCLEAAPALKLPCAAPHTIVLGTCQRLSFPSFRPELDYAPYSILDCVLVTPIVGSPFACEVDDVS